MNRKGPGKYVRIANPERTIASAPAAAPDAGRAEAEAYVRDAVAKGSGIDLAVVMDLLGAPRSEAQKYLTGLQDAIASEKKRHSTRPARRSVLADIDAE